MSANKYTLFDEQQGCSQSLPVNDIVEHVAFGRIFPIQGSVEGAPVAIPLGVASPAIARYVEALGDGDRNRKGFRADVISNKWKVKVTPYKPLRQINISNVEHVVANQSVSVGGKQYPLDMTPDKVMDLLAGNPVRAFLAKTGGKGNEQVVLQPKQTAVALELRKARRGMLPADATGDNPATAAGPAEGGSNYGDTASVTNWLKSMNYQLAVYIPYTQDWKLLGYSRGSLVNSFALAPQEELTLETYTWDRTKSSSESDFSLESETLSEQTTTAKSSFEAVLETRKNEKWNASLHAEIPLPSTPVKASGNLGAEGTVDKLNKQTVSYINEAVSKTSSRLKSSRQVKISEAKEVGREDRSKRFIRNPNMCHALHFDYFEVLENYKVTTASDAAKAKLCVIMDIPIRIDAINNEYGLVAYEGVLRGKVPKDFDKAFDSAHKLVAFHRFCYFKCMPRCTCGTPPAQGQTTSNPEGDLRDAAGRFIGSVIAVRDAGFKELNDLIEQDLESKLPPAPFFTPPPPPTEADWSSAKANAFRAAYKLVVMEGFASRYWSECLRFAALYPDSQNTAAIKTADCEAMAGAADANVIDVLNVINALNLFQIKTAVKVVGLAVTYPLAIAWMLANGAFDNAGMDLTFGAMKAAIDPVKAAQQKVTTDPTATADNTQDDAVASDLANAYVDVRALISFIQLNASHYKLLIWNALDEVDKTRLLMGMTNAGQYLLPNVLGLVGDKVAVEFNPAAESQAVQWLKKFVRGISDSVETAITLPSPGVSMQTRLGQCDACEPFIEDSRKIELQRLQAVADQQSSEAERMKLRVHNKKDYSDPVSHNPSISVTLDQNASKAEQ